MATLEEKKARRDELLDELEGLNSGLPPLGSILKGLRKVQEKKSKVFVTNRRCDIEQEAEKYHQLYAPPLIPVRYWMWLKSLPQPVLLPVRMWLSARLHRFGGKITRWAYRIGHA